MSAEWQVVLRETGRTCTRENFHTEQSAVAFLDQFDDEARPFFDVRPVRSPAEVQLALRDELLEELVVELNAMNAPDMLDGYLDSLAEEFNDRLPEGCPKLTVKELPVPAGPVTVWVQQWEESERDWGVRPDGATLHLTEKDLTDYIHDVTKDRVPGHPPDEYDRPCGRPYTVEMPEDDPRWLKLVEVLNNPKANPNRRGVWVSNAERPDPPDGAGGWRRRS